MTHTDEDEEYKNDDDDDGLYFQLLFEYKK